MTDSLTVRDSLSLNSGCSGLDTSCQAFGTSELQQQSTGTLWQDHVTTEPLREFSSDPFIYAHTGQPECDISGDGNAVFLFHLSGILALASVSIAGNSVVIYIMLKDKTLNSPLNYFITSLAISDLVQGVLYAIYNIGHINIDYIRLTIG